MPQSDDLFVEINNFSLQGGIAVPFSEDHNDFIHLRNIMKSSFTIQ